MIKTILIGSTLLVAGLVAGMGIERFAAADSGKIGSAHASGGTPLALLQQARAQQSGAAPTTLDMLQLRAMMREELGSALTAALANSSSGNASAPASAPAPLVTASPQQQEQAIQAARAIVESGRWSNLDRMNFHQQLAQLDPVQREQAMQALVQAIDNGAMELPDGPAL